MYINTANPRDIWYNGIITNTRSKRYDWNTNQRIRKLSIIILTIFHDIDKFCMQLQTLKIFMFNNCFSRLL